MQRLGGHRALITGAGSGIGRATAQQFANEGAELFLIDVAEDGLVETATTTNRLGAETHTQIVDVRDDAQVDSAVAAAVDVMGGIDVVANIAGVQRWAHSHQHSTEDYRLMMDVNVGGTFFLCRSALPHLVESNGCIINTASTTSFRGLPYSSVYAATKGAVLQLTRSLALEYAAQGVRVNAVAPGTIITGMTQDIDFPEGIDFRLILRQNSLQGQAGPEKVATVIAMLASADASHINGECIVVDGAAIA